MNPHELPIPAGIMTEPAVRPVRGLMVLEGPAYDAHGNLFFSDITGDRIMQLATDGKLTVFRENTGRANGNVFDSEGRLLTCEMGGRRIVRTDMKSGEVTAVAERYEGKRYNSP